MNLRDIALVKPLHLFNTDETMELIITYVRVSSIRSGLSRLKKLGNAQSEEESEVNAMIDLFNLVNTSLEGVNTVGMQSLYPYVSAYGSSWSESEWFMDAEKSISLYFSCHMYVSIAREYDNWSDSSVTEILDYFRFCMYIPLMVIQQNKRRLIMGRHSETGKFIYQNTKVALPSLKWLQSSSKKFEFEGNFFGSQKRLDTSSLAYFLFPLLVCASTLSEKDSDLIPSMWQHSSFIEHRDLPVFEDNWADTIDYVNEHRVYPIPEEGIKVVCKNYGDIQSMFFKERNYRGIEDVRDLFCKITFKDGFEDLVVLSLSHRAIQISAYMDIYETEDDLVSNLVMKVYSDFACQRPQEKNYDTRKKRMIYGYSDKKYNRETMVYLPRSVSSFYGDVSKNVDTHSNTGKKQPHWVDKHTRKLPPGRKASDKAKVLASQFGIVLPYGRTFVAPYHTGDKAMEEKVGVSRNIKPKDKVYISRL